jgi:lipopolysaccharide assembly protein B
MDLPIISYRDPLLSIFILVSIIFVVSYSNYLWGKFKRKEEKKEIDNFIDNFTLPTGKQNYQLLLENHPESIESLKMLAPIYLKNGDFEESIVIYLALLEKLSAKEERLTLLGELGDAYQKAGFLHRSRDIYLEAIKLKSRSPRLLENLLIIYERLKEYTNALDVIASLEELKSEELHERGFIEAMIIIEYTKSTTEQKVEALATHLIRYPYTAHVALGFIFKHSPGTAWGLLPHVDETQLLDIFWSLKKEDVDFSALKNRYLQAIFAAKGWCEAPKEEYLFELTLLSKLDKNYDQADLDFEYICDECKQIFPIFFHRCPSCHEVGSVVIEPMIGKRQLVASYELFS